MLRLVSSLSPEPRFVKVHHPVIAACRIVGSTRERSRVFGDWDCLRDAKVVAPDPSGKVAGSVWSTGRGRDCSCSFFGCDSVASVGYAGGRTSRPPLTMEIGETHKWARMDVGSAQPRCVGQRVPAMHDAGSCSSLSFWIHDMLSP